MSLVFSNVSPRTWLIPGFILCSRIGNIYVYESLFTTFNLTRILSHWCNNLKFNCVVYPKLCHQMHQVNADCQHLAANNEFFGLSIWFVGWRPALHCRKCCLIRFLSHLGRSFFSLYLLLAVAWSAEVTCISFRSALLLLYQRSHKYCRPYWQVT